MRRECTEIQVGVHEDKVGFTMRFDDDAPEHLLFKPEVFRALATAGLKLCDNLEYLQKHLGVPNDKVSVRDEARVQILPPVEGNGHG